MDVLRSESHGAGGHSASAFVSAPNASSTRTHAAIAEGEGDIADAIDAAVHLSRLAAAAELLRAAARPFVFTHTAAQAAALPGSVPLLREMRRRSLWNRGTRVFLDALGAYKGVYQLRNLCAAGFRFKGSPSRSPLVVVATQDLGQGAAEALVREKGCTPSHAVACVQWLVDNRCRAQGIEYVRVLAPCATPARRRRWAVSLLARGHPVLAWRVLRPGRPNRLVNRSARMGSGRVAPSALGHAVH